MRFYQSELMRCTNLLTGKTTYFVKKCDVFQRVSRDDYELREIKSDGFSCVYSKTTKRHRRQYITAIYEAKQ